MQLKDAKADFIRSWGALGSKWGINRTMAQVHALLLITNESISADAIMHELSISRGNANMNLRALVDWGLVKKELKPGDRKEYFFAEKDMWKMSRQIIRERKKRELDPIQSLLKELQTAPIEGSNAEVNNFKTAVKDLQKFTLVADKWLDRITASDRNWVLHSIKEMIEEKG